MFEEVRSTIGVQIARFHYRRSEDPVMSFTDAVTAARRALLIMPLRKREFLPTILVIDFLKRRFREENLTILSDDHGREAVRLLPRSHFIHILNDEISPLFLPRRTLLYRVRERRCDLVVDLNLDFLLPSAYICRESNARVRIGFTRRYAESFYNFLIQPDPQLERKHVYDRMASLLQGF